MTAVIVASQLGLADHYSHDADALMAEKQTQPVGQQTVTRPVQPRS